MDIEKIKLGTKIKMITDGKYWKKGANGLICNGSCFHLSENDVRDGGGQFWAKIEGSKSLSGRCCLDLEDFKILKY